ncbi:MAG: TrmJ/YjtD family RNA methyltransferase [Anaerolineae bacterium]|nr:TrmJ/YjtD family RNA methyltransferase [Anaerolineae bacterium]
MNQDPLAYVVIVLVEPQSADNVGATLRAMRTMGLTQLRLVRPADLDWSRLPVIAHRTQGLVARVRVFERLDEALADTVYALGCTARRRSLALPTLTPAEAAPAALARAQVGPAAFLFGREDVGLSNADLAHCHALLTIPTDPTYPSLNLAQAVMVVAYELRLAALPTTTFPAPAPSALATGADTEALFAALDETMRAVDYLIPSRAEATVRALRTLLLRAAPTAEEAALVTALLRAVARRAVR